MKVFAQGGEHIRGEADHGIVVVRLLERGTGADGVLDRARVVEGELIGPDAHDRSILLVLLPDSFMQAIIDDLE
jgi:hypothetical protein